MAFTPWRKNKQIVIDDDVQEQDPAMSRNAVQQSHPDHQVNNGSIGFGSVNAERPTFININRLNFFGRRGSSSNSTTTTQENEDEPIHSNVDCTLRLGCPTEPPSQPQQVQLQLQQQGGDDNLSAVINNYFPPNNIVPQELMQNYEVMNGRTPPYHHQHSHSQQHINNRFVMDNFNQNNYQQLQNYEVMNGTTSPYHRHSQHHINNRFVMNNFNQNNYQLQQQFLNSNQNMIANYGGRSVVENNHMNNFNQNNYQLQQQFLNSNQNMIANHGGGSVVENNQRVLFNGGGSPSPMNVGMNNRMNFNVPFLNNNNIPPFPAPQLPPAPPIFLAAPNYPPPSESIKRCFACNTARTPLWRNGPKGPKSLCNACGIRYKKEVRKIMGAMAPDGGQQGDKRGKF